MSSRPRAFPLSQSLDLSVLALGMVTPQGPDALTSVLYMEAGVAAAAPSPYGKTDRDADAPEDERPIQVAICPWLPVPGKGATPEAERLAFGDRLYLLALTAAQEALTALLSPSERQVSRAPRSCPPGAQGLALHLCVPAPKPGLTTEELDRVSKALATALQSGRVYRYLGDAGVFDALREARLNIAQGKSERALVVAVDSAMSLLCIDAGLRFPVNDWAPLPPRPSEGAAAFLVGKPNGGGDVPRSLATIHYSEVAQGAATDNDDHRVDGNAMALLIRNLPEGVPVPMVFGQEQVCLLRSREWEFSASRERERFDLNVESFSVESKMGRLGAAAGAISLAYAITAIRAELVKLPPNAPVCVWAISPGGLRGLALLSIRPEESES